VATPPEGSSSPVENGSPLSRSPPGVTSPIAASGSPVLARSSSGSPLPASHSTVPPQSTTASSTQSATPTPPEEGESNTNAPTSPQVSSGPGIVEDISSKLELHLLKEVQDQKKRSLEEKIDQMRKELDTQNQSEQELLRQRWKEKKDRKAKGEGQSKTIKRHHRHVSGSLPEPLLPPRQRVPMDITRAKTQRAIPTAQLTITTASGSTSTDSSPLPLSTPPPTPNPDSVHTNASSALYVPEYGLNSEGVLHSFESPPSEHRTVVDHRALNSLRTTTGSTTQDHRPDQSAP